MDPSEVYKFVTDGMEGIPERCVCGKEIIRERAPSEAYDYLPGKRFFTCKEYKNDGRHYRQPWVCPLEEELDNIKKSLEGCMGLITCVLDLEVENRELKEEVFDARPPGIKAAKAAKKKKGPQEEAFSNVKTVLEMKAQLNNQKLLEKLLEKPEPLSEMEMSLKLKLMSQMLTPS